MKRGEEPSPAVNAVPRISRLMALAIHMQDLVDSGEVADYAELARLAHVSRPRITQIMNLTLLAPDVQEAILFLPLALEGTDKVTERGLRTLTGDLSFVNQRSTWHGVMWPTTRTRHRAGA